MDSTQQVLKIGDIVSFHTEVKNNQFMFGCQSYIPCVVTLTPLAPIEPFQSFFRIERPKIVNVEEYPNPDDETVLPSTGDDNQELISFGEPIIFINCLSGRYLMAKQSQGQSINLVVSQEYRRECEFRLMPLFRCQTLGSKKVRHGEEILVRSIAYQQNPGLYNLPVLKDTSPFVSSMSKSDATSFRINRRGCLDGGKYISFRRFYKIKNIQIDRCIVVHNNNISFSQPLNQLETMFYFTCANQMNKLSQIQREDPVCIRSVKHQKFVQLHGGDFRVTDKQSKACQFRLVQYRNNTQKVILKDGVLLLLHTESNRYLSFQFDNGKGDFTSKPSVRLDLKDTIQLVSIADSVIRENYFISQFRAFLESFATITDQKQERIEHLLQLKDVLQEMLTFLFKQSKTVCETKVQRFFQLDTFKPCISQNHVLFKEWNIGGLIYKVMGFFVASYRQLTTQIKSADGKKSKKSIQKDDILQRIQTCSHTIKTIFVLIVGMCKSSPKNIRILLVYYKCIFDNLDLDLGAIQCLIHIFKNNKEFLKLLQLRPSEIGGTYLNILITQIRKVPRSKISLAIKLSEFLRCLVNGNEEGAVKTNQTIIGDEFITNKLQQILFCSIECDEGDQLRTSMFEDPNDFEQISEMYNKKTKYHYNLVLVQSLLMLYADLCAGRNYPNLEYFKTKFPLKTVLRYTNSATDGALKNCFLRILLHTYLDSLPRRVYRKNNVVCLQLGQSVMQQPQSYDLTSRLLNKDMSMQVQMKEISSYDYEKQLNEIKAQLLTDTLQQMLDSKPNQSSSISLQILYNYLNFNLFSQDDKAKLKSFFLRFFNQKSVISDEYREDICFVALRILHKFEEQNQERNVKQVVTQLLSKRSVDVVSVLNEVLGKSRKSEDDKALNFVKALLAYCQEFKEKPNKSFIDIGLDLIKKKLCPRQILVRNLKKVLLIDQPELVERYNNIKTFQLVELQLHIQRFTIAMIKSDTSFVSQSVRKLNQVLEDLNIGFSLQSHDNKKYQYMIKQLGVHRIILGFLSESLHNLNQNTIPIVSKVYKSTFKFLSLFIDKNRSNTKVVIRQIKGLKEYLVLPQMGQSHFFLMLARLEDIKFKIEESIVLIVLQNMKNNIYLTSILNQYCKKETLPNMKFIDRLSKRLLNDETLFTDFLMLKKHKGISDLALGQRKLPQLIYYVQLFRLLNTVFEYSSDKKYLIQTSKRYISLDIILRALQSNDIWEQRSSASLVFTILEEELIKCARLLKLTDTNIGRQNQELVEAFLQKSYKKIHFYNEETENQKNNYVGTFKENHSSELYDVILLTESFVENQETFNNKMNYVFYMTNLLGPLVAEMSNKYLQNPSKELSQLSLKETVLLQDSFSKQLKQAVYDLLTKEDFDRSPNEYLKGVGKCEQLFKCKIKFGFQVSKERKDFNEQQIGQIFHDNRLDLVLSLYRLGQTQVEVNLYKRIYNTLHDHQLRVVIEEQKQRFSRIVVDALHDPVGVLNLLGKMLVDRLQDGDFDNSILRRSLGRVVLFIGTILQIKTTSQLEFQTMTHKIAQPIIRWCSRPDSDSSIYSRLVSLLAVLLVRDKKPNIQFQTRVFGIIRQMNTNNQFFQKLRVILRQEELDFSNLILNQTRRCKVVSQVALCYGSNRLQTDSLNLALSVLKSLVQGANTQNKLYIGSQMGFLQILLNLLKTTVQFAVSFSSNNRVYYNNPVHIVLSSTLETVLHFVNYQPVTNIQMLIEKGFISTLMNVLLMNDYIKEQDFTHSRSEFDQLEYLIEHCSSDDHRKYLKSVYNISRSSLQVYKDLSTFHNPFFPSQPNYLRPKTAAIRILMELICLQNKSQSLLLFRGVSQTVVKANIISVYSKHLITYGNTYQVAAFYNKERVFKLPTVGRIDFRDLVEESNYIENGFMLVYLLRRTVSHREQIDKEIEDLKKWKGRNQSLLAPIREAVEFSAACWRLFKGCFKSCSDVQSKITEESQRVGDAMRFFLFNSGRVEVIKGETLHSIDFPVLPECVRKAELQKDYLEEVDLTSVQSKSESILKYTEKFVLLYENQERYKVKYRSLPFIDLLLQHINFFKNISFMIIIILNILILVTSRTDIDMEKYTQRFVLFKDFIVIQMSISYALLLFFLLKQLPLIILQVNKSIQIRRNTYGSNFNTYPRLVQIGIRVWMFIYQPQLLYHLLFTTFVTISYFIPVFVSVLLLDIIIRIPLLRRILMSIWRPKIQIILALVAFILVEYYFSIILFFSFQDRTYGYCSYLQECFSFVYFVTYKVVGGFPGFIFQYKQQGSSSFEVDGFSIFSDIYIVVVFEIFFAVLVGIIIDNFSILRTEEDERRHHLENFCLICGVNKAVINESNTRTNFLKHVREDHNIWNYFYFFTYINKKQTIQRTEVEEYISNCLDNKSSQWLPLNYMAHLHKKI